MIIGLAALLVCTSGVAAQEKRMNEEQRKELEQKLERMRQEFREQERAMRELERQLGRERAMVFMRQVPDAPLAFAISSSRPRLGVIVRTDRDVATDSIGAVLDAVTPDGPAAKAGLRAGDIVVTFDGERLGTTTGSPGERLIDLAGKMTEGDTVRVAFRRGKDAKTAVIVPKVLDDFSYSYAYTADSAMGIARRALERAMVVAPRVDVMNEGRNVWAVRISERWSDMELTTIDPDLGTYFGAKDGLLVVRAPKDSLLGLKSGDVILRIGGRVPSSPSHAMRIFRSYDPGDEIRIDIMRDKAAREIKAIVPTADDVHWEEK